MEQTPNEPPLEDMKPEDSTFKRTDIDPFEPPKDAITSPVEEIDSVNVIRLKPKHEQFCREYVKSGNATQSYKNVYGVEGKSVEVRACELVKQPKIQLRIQQIMEHAQVKSELDPDYLIRYSLDIIKQYRLSGKYREALGPCLNILKDYAGISTKTENKNLVEVTEDRKRKIRDILRQAKKIRPSMLKKIEPPQEPPK